MWVRSPPPAQVTAEFPEGFRLLKAAAYLIGLVGRWRPAAETIGAAHVHVSPRVQCPSNERLLVSVFTGQGPVFREVAHWRRDADRRSDIRRAAPRRAQSRVSADGEVMSGSVVAYRPNARGFFIQPPNGRGNNLQIYAISAAIRRVRFV